MRSLSIKFHLKESSNITIRLLKQKICISLVSKHLNSKRKQLVKEITLVSTEAIVMVLPSNKYGCLEGEHLLVTNWHNKKVTICELNCYLCMMVLKEKNNPRMYWM